MAQRIFLALSVLIWLPYGIFCFVQPGGLGESAGVLATSATGLTEIRAMYGGLQASIGALALLACFRAEAIRPALWTLAVLTTGLGVSRLFGAIIDGEFSGYTTGALVFELLSASAAWALLRRLPAQERV